MGGYHVTARVGNKSEPLHSLEPGSHQKARLGQGGASGGAGGIGRENSEGSCHREADGSGSLSVEFVPGLLREGGARKKIEPRLRLLYAYCGAI